VGRIALGEVAVVIGQAAAFNLSNDIKGLV